MKKNKSAILFWLGVAALVLAVLLMSSCSATKRVLKDPVKTEAVAVEFIKKNPRKNDTTYLPGQVIIKDTTLFDTIPLPYPVKEKYTQTNIKEILLRDTIRIVDRTFEQALVKRVEALENDFAEMKASRNKFRTEAWIWRGLIFAIMAFFILKPFIKTYLKI